MLIGKYQNIMEPGKTLSIFTHRTRIVEAIQAHGVVVISGRTGCGKSTQVAQFILKAEPRAIIAVCEPKRLAAKTLAMWVSKERKCPVGGQVGFHIGMEPRASARTRLVYMTYGVFISKLLFCASMNYTHVILDEVHQRSLEMDFVFIALKKLLNEGKVKCKVVVMSATINTTEFKQYFSFHPQTHKLFMPEIVYRNEEAKRRPERGRDREASSIGITKVRVERKSEQFIDAECIDLADGRTYSVQVFYESREFFKFHEAQDEVYISEDHYRRAEKIITEYLKSSSEGDVLVFLPGMAEIQKLKRNIQDMLDMVWRAAPLTVSESKPTIVEVHSAFSDQLYSKLFQEKGQKIILATNIGESSITLPDCKIVVDFCVNRKSFNNNVTGMSRFETRLASKANLLQRAGRVGRVSDGIVHRLIERETYEKLMEFDIPEIKCVSLEMVILRIKQIEQRHKSHLFEDPYEVLMSVIEPPLLEDIGLALKILVRESALVFHKQQALDLQNARELKLSCIGDFMVSMPCDLIISKMVLLAFKVGLTQHVINIASILMSQKSFFVHQDRRINMEQFVHTFIEYDRQRFNDFLMRENIFSEWVHKFYDPFLLDKAQKKREKKKASLSIKEEKKSMHKPNKTVYVEKKVPKYIEKPPVKYIEKPPVKYVEKQSLKLILDEKKDTDQGLQPQQPTPYNTQSTIVTDTLQEEDAPFDEEVGADYIQDFLNIRISEREFAWCRQRSIYPLNMREILKIRENIRLKVEKLGFQFQSRSRPSNNLILLCIVYAFENRECRIDWQSSMDENRLEVNKLDARDIKNFCGPNSQFLIKEQLDLHGHPKRYLTGDTQVVLKLILPSKLKMEPQNPMSKFYNFLKTKPLQLPETANISYRGGAVKILSDSINIVCFRKSRDHDYFLITDNIIESKFKKMVAASALVESHTFAVMQMLTQQQVMGRLHVSQEFITEIRIGRDTLFECCVRANELEVIKKFKKIIQKRPTETITRLGEEIQQNQIEALVDLLDQAARKQKTERWEKSYYRQLKITQPQVFFPIQRCPKMREGVNAFANYYEWKKTVLSKLNKFYNELTITKCAILCKSCSPELISIQSFSAYDSSTQLLKLNEFTGNWKNSKGVLYCEKGHEIGLTVDKQFAQLNKDALELYIPYQQREPFCLAYDEEALKRLRQKELIGAQKVSSLKNRLQEFDCPVCVEDEVMEDANEKLFSKSYTGERNWKHITKHMVSPAHLKNLREFRKTLK